MAFYPSITGHVELPEPDDGRPTAPGGRVVRPVRRPKGVRT